MLNLSVNEQKQIVGGLWEAIVYADEVNEVTDCKIFKTKREARKWIRENYPNSRYRIEEL